MSVIVETNRGAVRGETTAHGYVWRGIPFAAPPVGPLRFRPPQPARAWTGVRDCRVAGPTSVWTYQPDTGSEDCLNLNVWSPVPDSARRPVLVWIHGGGFVGGSGSEYDGAALAARGDAVVVTVNYRLGPWGLLYLEHLDSEFFAGTANPALRDLVASLSWVRANIEAFGGDPGNVTVLGESAGAMLIGALLGVPAASDLFARGVLLSGAARFVLTPDDAALATRRLLAHLGLDESQGRRLTDVPTHDLAVAAEAVRMDASDRVLGGYPYQPVVDGDLLVGEPMAAVAAGRVRDKPFVIGWCRDEMALLVQGSGDLEAKAAYGRFKLGGEIWDRLVAGLADVDGGLERLVGEAMFVMPAIGLADAHAGAGGRTWMFRLDHTPSAPPFDTLGPTHAADVALLWSEIPTFGPLAAMPELRTTPMTAADRSISAALQDLVLAFARSGSPSGRGLPDWPGYDRARRRTLLLAAEPTVVDDPERLRREAWTGVGAYAG